MQPVGYTGYIVALRGHLYIHAAFKAFISNYFIVKPEKLAR